MSLIIYPNTENPLTTFKATHMDYLRIFNADYINRTPKESIIIQSDIKQLRKLYAFNIEQIISYYSNRSFIVKNTFILSRILEHIPVYLGYSAPDYVNMIDKRVEYLAKHFKVTSEIEKGVVHPGYLFGEGNNEILISQYDYFNPYEVEKKWKRSNPIKILTHNRNDLNLLLPNGKDIGSRTGICSVMIDFNMLALKYREFMKEVQDTNVLLTKNHFMYKYVINLTMPDIIDHVFLNKVMDKFYGREEVTPKFKHVFKIYKPHTQIDRYINNTLDVITDVNHDYVNILKNIKLMTAEDASELLSLAPFLNNRQLTWAMFLSRLDYMIFLYDLNPRNNSRNMHHVNDWKRLVTRIENDGVLAHKFSYEVEKEIKEKMYKIKNM